MSAASTAAAKSATTTGVSLLSTASNPNVSCSESAEAIAAAAGLPQHILKTILESPKIQNPPCKIDSIEECQSAQQQVFVVRLRDRESHHEVAGNEAVQLDFFQAPCDKKVAKRAVVVRIWKGGARWWNLHRNESVGELATAELEGYSFAHRAFVSEKSRSIDNQLCPTGGGDAVDYESASTRIPDIVESCNLGTLPWAILEYVGPGSSLFRNDESNCDENDKPPSPLHSPQKQAAPPYRMSTLYRTGMVKVRHEFGFDEPHPRWGRVPTNQALVYARMVLNQVVFPLHHYSFTIFRNDLAGDEYTYGRVVQLYKKASQDMKANVQQLNPAHSDSQADKLDNENRMLTALCCLDEAVIALEDNEKIIPPMFAPVMVHLDLQPQNLIFGIKDGDCPGQIRILAVLDWEDAAKADPRFELLLLCRKVCANREQADALWSEYRQWHEKETSQDLGPIKPWLQLETVHSVCTLLLQSMDLLNGGRNPWETKSDLWGKLEREFSRWDQW